MPSKSIERIPTTYAGLRDAAIESFIETNLATWRQATAQQRARPRTPEAAPEKDRAKLAHRGTIGGVAGGVIAIAALKTNLLWTLVACAVLLLVAELSDKIAVTLRERLVERRWRRSTLALLKGAPIGAVRWFLRERIDAAALAALGPNAPLATLRARLAQRYAESDSMAGRLERQAARREGEFQERLKGRWARIVALRQHLWAEIARLDRVIAAGHAFFAECQARADAFCQQLDEHTQDLALLQEADRVEGAAETDLAAVDGVLNDAVAAIAADLTEIRARFVDALDDPSRTLFAHDGTDALEQDLATCEALAEAAYCASARV